MMSCPWSTSTFANIDAVVRLSVSIHQHERQSRPVAGFIEQLLSDMADNVRVVAQGHPWGARDASCPSLQPDHGPAYQVDSLTTSQSEPTR